MQHTHAETNGPTNKMVADNAQIESDKNYIVTQAVANNVSRLKRLYLKLCFIETHNSKRDEIYA